MARPLVDLFVLDAIAHDADTYEAIMGHVNDEKIGWQDRHGGPIHPIEVQTALPRLVQDRLVEVYRADEVEKDFVGCGEGIWPRDRDVTEMWFDLTGRGRVLYLNWEQ